MYPIRIGLFLITLALIACSDDKLATEGAWIREAPPNATAMAGYVRIDNPSKTDQALVGAESAAFGAIEMHRTIIKDEVSRMQKQQSVPVPAGDAVSFEPGGHHLMLFRPQRPLKAGDKVMVTLKFESGDTLEVPFTVKRPE